MKVIIITHPNGSTESMTCANNHEVMAVVSRYSHAKLTIMDAPTTKPGSNGVVGFPMADGILKVYPGKDNVLMGTARMYTWNGTMTQAFPVVLTRRSSGLHVMWGGSLLRLRDQRVCQFR